MLSGEASRGEDARVDIESRAGLSDETTGRCEMGQNEMGMMTRCRRGQRRKMQQDNVDADIWDNTCNMRAAD